MEPNVPIFSRAGSSSAGEKPDFAHVAAGDLDAVNELVKTGTVAGIMVECVQGEGGVIPLDRDFVQGLASITAANDIPLMIDEVQTGNGRTGTLYAYMQFGIKPDIVSTAKGLAGGLPLGATLLSDKVKDVLSYGDHGSTFGGNPVCCSAALSVLSRIDDELLHEVQEKSKLIFNTLSGKPGIISVTGMGLMIGIKTVKPATEVVNSCIEKGVLCLTAKDKVRLLPALNIPVDLLSSALDVILSVCAD